ncbi:type III-A CRISPR-associated protein Csm2 [Fonticella tunisiensis]|uniref:CRISPR system Cms protein Csm2 n=1 Tax=Fonticella tunisiensis TaxID=1096341 RepID=A0A4V3ESU3_9CLOT|nr:type III-A CRISPR-associated protein Csm2 [Fonticella tunisiensis]TDT51292.1 CRISPR-associated Csm2 family protein [Fonticella tunisiensis]
MPGYNNGNNNKQRNNTNYQTGFNFTAQDAKDILNINERDGKVLFEKAQAVGRQLKDDKVTVSQIRKIYSEMRKINYDDKGDYKYELRLLKAQIAYSSGRFKELKNFKNVFDNLIDETVKGGKEELKRFKDFAEAVIAYHRAENGRE